MKLTIEKNPETVRRYDHVPAAPLLGGGRCGARSAGGSRRCTRETGHRGPHVAHGPLGRALEVWDAKGSTEVAAPQPRRSPPARSAASEVPLSPSLLTTAARSLWDGTVGRLIRNPPAMEEALLLVFFVGFVIFAVSWFLKMLG